MLFRSQVEAVLQKILEKGAKLKDEVDKSDAFGVSMSEEELAHLLDKIEDKMENKIEQEQLEENEDTDDEEDIAVTQQDLEDIEDGNKLEVHMKERMLETQTQTQMEDDLKKDTETTPMKSEVSKVQTLAPTPADIKEIKNKWLGLTKNNDNEDVDNNTSLKRRKLNFVHIFCQVPED